MSMSPNQNHAVRRIMARMDVVRSRLNGALSGGHADVVAAMADELGELSSDLRAVVTTDGE